MAHAMDSQMDLAAAGMMNEGKAKNEKKPPKVVKRIEHERGSDGTHVFTHHHTQPEHHKPEPHHYSPHKDDPHKHDEEAMAHFKKHAIAPGAAAGQAEAEEPAGEEAGEAGEE